MRLRRKRNSPGLAFEAFGVQLQLSFDDELETRIADILPPDRVRCKADAPTERFELRRTGPDAFEVTIGGVPVLEHASLDVALTMLDSQMRLTIAANARGWLFVHAGVVAVEGQVVVIPGGSFSGKTTLVQALVLAGATYYSDEYAVLDRHGLVHPYARPLSVRSSDSDDARKSRTDVTGATAVDRHAPLAAVIITRYRAGVEWAPRRLSTGQGLVALMANTVPAQDRPKESLRTLSRAVAGATVLEGDRGEAGPAAIALLDELRAAIDPR